MREKHPFGSFVPAGAKYLFLGTFVTKRDEATNNWFFSSRRNQFWEILGEVYGRKLADRKEKQDLFSELKMAITDIILECERSKNTNADNNLINLVFNVKTINEVLDKNKIEKIFFSSRYAEIFFRRNFKELIKKYPKIERVTLPSSSPRYARMRKEEKVKKYRDLLPKLDLG